MTESDRLPNQHRTAFAIGLALAVVLVVQALPFTWGYRRVADDVIFLDVLREGWGGIGRYALSASAHQGRLGFLGTMPINILASYFADAYWVRLTYVLLHFGAFALFAAYVSRLLAANVTFALLLVLLTLQGIDGLNDHMPPIAYPLQNTLPLVMLLAARLVILRADDRGRSGGVAVWLARLAFLVSLVLTEYIFLVGTAILACEYLARWFRAPNGDGTSLAQVRTLLDRRFLWDAGLVAVAVVAYFGYRWVFPSGYEGNVIDGAGAPWRIVATTARHVHAGTIFARDLLDVGSIPRQAMPLAVLAGLLTALCAYFVLCQARAIRAPLGVIAACIVAIAYVAFPLAGNARQQAWCLESGACGYLDSRLSYLGFGLILLCLIALALHRMPTRRAGRATVAILSGMLGLLGAASYAYNLRDGLEYANDARPWHRANLLACHPDLQSSVDRRLIRMIDPEARIRFHPGTDQAHFWRGYLALKGRNQSCSSDPELRQAERRFLNDAEPVLAVGRRVQFSEPSAARYLGRGWSLQEKAGIWTDGPRAELVFMLAPGAEARPLVLEVGFTAYMRPVLSEQEVGIQVDGRHAATWTITRTMHDGPVERTIPLEAGRRPMQEIEVVFHILSPRQPATDREIADTRQLGIFLRSMVLEPQAR